MTAIRLLVEKEDEFRESDPERTVATRTRYLDARALSPRVVAHRLPIRFPVVTPLMAGSASSATFWFILWFKSHSGIVRRVANPDAHISKPGARIAPVHNASNEAEVIGRIATILSDVLAAHL